MHTSRVPLWFRSMLVAVALALGLVTTASTAFAFGSFNLKQTSVEEVDGRWKFNVDVDYGSTPHLGHVPFDFVFVQKVYYEYSITDNDAQPVQRRKPMHNQPPQREQMDIAFADARGDLWRKTKFSFSVRRDRGFSAGEYTLTVKRSSDGQTLGRPMNITLNGQNELIDRRAIVFTGDPKKKKPEAKASGDSQGAEDKADKSADESADGEKAQDTVPEYMEDDESDEPAGPPPVDKKAKSGCGCRAAGLDVQGGTIPMAGLLLLGLMAWSRRRSHA